MFVEAWGQRLSTRTSQRSGSRTTRASMSSSSGTQRTLHTSAHLVRPIVMRSKSTSKALAASSGAAEAFGLQIHFSCPGVLVTLTWDLCAQR